MKNRIFFITLLAVGVLSLFVYLNSRSNFEQSKHSVNGISFNLDFIPSQTLIERDLASSDKTYKEIALRYENHKYFKLNINSNNGLNVLKYFDKKFGKKQAEEILRVLSFHSKDQIKLVVNNNATSCSIYHLDRSFVEFNGLEILVVFNMKTLQDAFLEENNVVRFEFDAEILNEDPVHFELDRKIINELREV